jgi:hypothetical protein
MLKEIEEKEIKHTYKSLYDVKDTFLPNIDLNFLECDEIDVFHNEFMKSQKKKHQTSEQNKTEDN